MTSEEEMSASAGVEAVVVQPNTIKVRSRLILRAYVTRAKTGRNLSRVFTPTIKGFNADYGTKCKSWADVAVEAERLLKSED